MKKYNKNIIKVEKYLDEIDQRNQEKEKKLIKKAVDSYFNTYPGFNKKNLETIKTEIIEYSNELHKETDNYDKEEIKIWFYTLFKILRTINNISYRDPREEPEEVIKDFKKLIKEKFAKDSYQCRKYNKELKD